MINYFLLRRAGAVLGSIPVRDVIPELVEGTTNSGHTHREDLYLQTFVIQMC